MTEAETEGEYETGGSEIADPGALCCATRCEKMPTHDSLGSRYCSTIVGAGVVQSRYLRNMPVIVQFVLC